MKPKTNGRQAFNFLLSYNRVVDKLKTDKQQCELLNIIRRVHFLQIKIEDIKIKDSMVDLAFESIKHSLEKSVYAYLDKANPEDMGVYGVSEHSTPHCDEHSTPQEEEEVQGEEEVEEQKVLLHTTVDVSLWNDFLILRKKLKAPNTPRALNALKKKLIKFNDNGYNLNDIIQTSYENGWKGLFEPKQQVMQRSSTNIDAALEHNVFDLIEQQAQQGALNESNV